MSASRVGFHSAISRSISDGFLLEPKVMVDNPNRSPI